MAAGCGSAVGGRARDERRPRRLPHDPDHRQRRGRLRRPAGPGLVARWDGQASVRLQWPSQSAGRDDRSARAREPSFRVRRCGRVRRHRSARAGRRAVPRCPAARAQATARCRRRGDGAGPPRNARPATDQRLAGDLADAWIPVDRVQGRQQPLPAGRDQRRLGDGADSGALRAEVATFTSRWHTPSKVRGGAHESRKRRVVRHRPEDSPCPPRS